MMGFGVDKYEKYLQELFLHKSSSYIPAGFSKHLSTCSTCRELFSSFALADRQPAKECGVDAQCSAFESEVLWESISQQLAIGSGYTAWWSGKLLVASFVLSILLLGGAVFWFSQRHSSAIRLSEQTMDRGGHLSPMVQYYCMVAEGEPRLMRGHPARCSMDGTLAFAYINPEGEYSGVALFALDEHNKPLWYLPDPVHPDPVLIERTTKPEAIPKTVRLDVNHEPGRYFLYYMFTPEPLSYKELNQALSKIATGGPPPDGSLLRKIQMEVEESR